MPKIKSRIRAIEWKGDHLRVLDQKKLPHQQSYFDCRACQDVARAISDMSLRGAPLIGCAAAYGLVLSAQSESKKILLKDASLLKKSRPTAVNLAHAVGAMLAAVQDVPEGGLFKTLEEAAIDYYEKDLESNRMMAAFGARLLPRPSKVITYCNAGALATSGIGTALGVIARAHREGKIKEVYACETRPYLQGSRLTLWELQRQNIPATLITDNMAAHLMKTEPIQAVIVGSDRIASNGDVCNKIGTYGLAVLAHRHKIPFYAVAPTSTIDFNCPDGNSIPIEERDANEVLFISGKNIAPKGARARHFAFDVTPANLITALVTEKGVISPLNRKNMRRILQ